MSTRVLNGRSSFNAFAAAVASVACVISLLFSYSVRAANLPNPKSPIIRPKAPPGPSAAEYVSTASNALQQGQLASAVELATRALAQEPTNFTALAVRGRAQSLLRQPALAVADFDAALKIDPSSARLYQVRGEDNFRIGHFKQSVADFDRYLETDPAQKPYHWQRGISCYYAGLYAEGRKQFELHQTVNAHDVENAVWHFLCVVRLEGLAKAREALIPIEGDSRVPMREVHQLFAGKIKPADVQNAAEAGDCPPKERVRRRCYANLYLGLYFEALKQTAEARTHIFKAATEFPLDDYMGDVARSHAAALRASGATK